MRIRKFRLILLVKIAKPSDLSVTTLTRVKKLLSLKSNNY